MIPPPPTTDDGPRTTDKKRIVVVSQTFVPDPASVGQHMADVAFELARRGNDVRVFASGRGYEDSSVVYPARETLHGADIRRFAFGSFGKKSILRRILGTAYFHCRAFYAVLFKPKLDGIFFSTSPPLIGLPVCIAGFLRRVPVVYWAMDLNPDQLIGLGKIQGKSLTAKVLESINRFILHRSKLIIALDRFMADRLAARGVARQKMLVMPPWPHEEHMVPDSTGNPFKDRHDLNDKFVIMYSGNHSPSNPLTTLLQAAVQLKDDDKIRFLFVGGGTGKREVDACIADHKLTNTLSLPYQPMADLKYSLTAADVHVVSLGESMVGIIHPCKIYGAMSAGRPILFLGPRPSHISDLLDEHVIGLAVRHGDLPGTLSTIAQFRNMSDTERQTMGKLAQTVLAQSLSQRILNGQLCDAIEVAIKSER